MSVTNISYLLMYKDINEVICVRETAKLDDGRITLSPEHPLSDIWEDDQIDPNIEHLTQENGQCYMVDRDKLQTFFLGVITDLYATDKKIPVWQEINRLVENPEILKTLWTRLSKRNA